METNQNKHRRRSIRLQFYDYSASGAYFVTVCTQERRCLFGDAVDGVVQLNDAGRAVERSWLAIPQHFPHIDLDAFVVMPNHVHGVIIIGDRPVGAKDFSPLHNTSQPGRRPSGALPKTIGSIVRGFKIGVTKWFRDNTDTYAVWQRNDDEHVDPAMNLLSVSGNTFSITLHGGRSTVRIQQLLHWKGMRIGLHECPAM